MRQVCLFCLNGLLVVSSGLSQTANYADRVVAYDPGHDPGPLTNTLAVLGEPSRQTVDPQRGTFPVDPFGPPYLASQLVALGDAGSLTLRFEHPLTDDSANPYGLDFVVFGNAFFQFNGDWTTTSGLLGGTNAGVTTVSVSPDGLIFYTLDPELAPNPDGWFPTDHAGSPTRPVDPALTTADFAGQGLDGIRELYDGSAGGTGYDLAWARDSEGNPVILPFVRYVRFDQHGGTAQFDAVSAISPPPSFFADFTTDPAAEGWRAFGETSLFRWSSENQNVHVTWDSSRDNSYFHRPLGVTLNRQDDFALGFDLQLDTVTIGVDPDKPFTFQIAIGLIHLESATNTALWRASGVDAIHGPRNLVEFAYFPDSGFGATIAPSIISSNNQFASQFDYPIELSTNATFSVLLRYTAIDHTLRTTLSRNHAGFADIQDVVLPVDFTDFIVDAVAICSYSDAGQDPRFGGSILAEGSVDNIYVQLPSPPVDQLVGLINGDTYQITFTAKAGWTYSLERSTDLAQWATATNHSATTSATLTLTDPSPPAQQAFYRVSASR
jgi:hypothetical protein